MNKVFYIQRPETNRHHFFGIYEFLTTMHNYAVLDLNPNNNYIKIDTDNKTIQAITQPPQQEKIYNISDHTEYEELSNTLEKIHPKNKKKK